MNAPPLSPAEIRDMFDWFARTMPRPETELTYENGFQLLVAVILSAQCTDKRVNLTTPAFFAQFPTPQALAAADFDAVFPYIKSISYPNNKTKNLLAMAKMLVEHFGGEVPEGLDTLQKLPGVGRKTANVISAVLHGQATMAVDTHVFRVANRLGLVQAKNVLQTEKQLLAALPPEVIHDAHHWLILHGRYICKARKPLCQECGLRQICRYYQQNQSHAVS